MKKKFIGKDFKVKYLGNYLKNGQVLEFTEEEFKNFNGKNYFVNIETVKVKIEKKRGKK